MTREEIINAAQKLSAKGVTKRWVTLTIKINERTKELPWYEQEKIVNRIWRQIKKSNPYD